MVTGGGTVSGSLMATTGSVLHSVTSLCVCPGSGWIRRDTGLPEEISLPNAEFGPERGRLGSVNTALNDPPFGGRSRGPCLAVKSPTRHRRGLSLEQRAGFVGGFPSTWRELQASSIVPSLRLQSNSTGGRSSGEDLRLREGGEAVGASEERGAGRGEVGVADEGSEGTEGEEGVDKVVVSRGEGGGGEGEPVGTGKVV